MGDKILTCILIAIGSGVLAYATLGRIFGFHRSIGWIGGGQVSLVGELSTGIFVLCCGLVLLHSLVWAIPAIAAFAVSFISQGRANRQCRAKKKNFDRSRRRNKTG